MPVERVGDHPEIAQPLVTAPCPVNLALECEDMPWLRNQEPLPAGHATELRESESLRSTRRPPRSRQCVEEFRNRRTTTQRHPAATPFAQGADMQHHLIHAPSGDAGNGYWATEHRSPSLLQEETLVELADTDRDFRRPIPSCAFGAHGNSAAIQFHHEHIVGTFQYTSGRVLISGACHCSLQIGARLIPRTSNIIPPNTNTGGAKNRAAPKSLSALAETCYLTRLLENGAHAG